MRSREASLVLLIAVLTAITTVLNPRFLSPQSLKDLMLNVSIIALLVLGQTIIILMRQIDLSISSIVGITAFLSGTLFVNHPGIVCPSKDIERTQCSYQRRDLSPRNQGGIDCP